MKNLLSPLKKMVEETINSIDIELLEGNEGTNQKKDENGKPNGEKDNFFKLTCQIPKGHGVFSNVQFDVKIPKGYCKYKEFDLDEKELYVRFSDLEVSYLDSRNVYLRASDYEVYELEEV